jgi:hypothetical protein
MYYNVIALLALFNKTSKCTRFYTRSLIVDTHKYYQVNESDVNFGKKHRQIKEVLQPVPTISHWYRSITLTHIVFWFQINGAITLITTEMIIDETKIILLETEIHKPIVKKSKSGDMQVKLIICIFVFIFILKLYP